MARSAPPIRGAQVYASNAIEGALTGFLARSRASIERQRAAGQIPEANRAEVQRAFDGDGPSRHAAADAAGHALGRDARSAGGGCG